MKDLMKPRYLVIADYPDSLRKVGDIVECEYPDTNRWDGVLHLAKYPHLFRPLSWWEFRDEKDMRGYFKCAWRGEIYCIKIDKWEKDGSMYYYKIDGMTFCANYSTPTTATDYENYLNQQKP